MSGPTYVYKSLKGDLVDVQHEEVDEALKLGLVPTTKMVNDKGDEIHADKSEMEEATKLGFKPDVNLSVSHPSGAPVDTRASLPASMALSVAEGISPFADQIGGLASAVPASVKNISSGKPADFANEYRSGRDKIVQAHAQVNEDYPFLGPATEIVSGIAAPLGPVVKGAKALKGATTLQKAITTAGNVGKAAGVGAGIGAVQGAAKSKGDLTKGEVQPVLEDTASGAAIGGVTGGVLSSMIHSVPVLSASVRKLASSATGLTEEQVIRYVSNSNVVRAARNSKELLAGIQDALKSFSKETQELSGKAKNILMSGERTISEAVPESVERVSLPPKVVGRKVISEATPDTTNPITGELIPGKGAKTSYVDDVISEPGFTEKVTPGTPAQKDNIYKITKKEIEDSFDNQINYLKQEEAGDSEVGRKLISYLEAKKLEFATKDRLGISAKRLLKNFDRDMNAYKKSFPEGAVPDELTEASRRIRGELNSNLQRNLASGEKSPYAEVMQDLATKTKTLKLASKTFGNKDAEAPLGKIRAISKGQDTKALDVLADFDAKSGSSFAQEAKDSGIQSILSKEQDAKIREGGGVIDKFVRPMTMPAGKLGMDVAASVQPALKWTLQHFDSLKKLGLAPNTDKAARILTMVKQMATEGRSPEEIQNYVETSTSKKEGGK